MSVVSITPRDAKALVDRYDVIAAALDTAVDKLGSLVSESHGLLEWTPHPNANPVNPLGETSAGLRSDGADLAWRIDWIESNDNTSVPYGTINLLDVSRTNADALALFRQLERSDDSYTNRAEQNSSRLAEVNERIENWPGSDNDPILDALIRERNELLRTQSVLGTAEATGIPEDYAELLLDRLGVPPGEIIVGFGGIDVNRDDIKALIQDRPADQQFENFINALAATAITEQQLVQLEESESSAVQAYEAWAAGNPIDTDDLAEHNLVLQTGGVEGYGTWYVVRSEQGIAIAAWYDAPAHQNAFDNLTIAESTAEFRRGTGLATEEDEIYQGFLDSGDHGETDAAAFAFFVNGDREQADDVRLGAWPGNYLGAVAPSAITDPHVWLDVAGLVPIIGEFADITNAGLYLVEGDLTNSAISAIATVPFLGSLASARRAANRLDGTLVESVQYADGQVLHTIRRADGSIAQVVELTDGQVLRGPSTLVQSSGIRSIDEVAPNLTDADRIALRDYTGEGYRELNSSLRGGSVHPDVQVRVDAVNDALEKLPPYVGEVSRGVDLPESIAVDIKRGGVFEDQGFLSTSFEEPFSGDFHFTIQSRTGRDIAAHSAYEIEAEVLFRPGTRFAITDVTIIDGVHYVDMREIT